MPVKHGKLTKTQVTNFKSLATAVTEESWDFLAEKIRNDDLLQHLIQQPVIQQETFKSKGACHTLGKPPGNITRIAPK